MAVRAVPSIPSVTCSAVEDAENPDAPFQPRNHIFTFAHQTSQNTNHCLSISVYKTYIFYSADCVRLFINGKY